jgi:hypothetical protein
VLGITKTNHRPLPPPSTPQHLLHLRTIFTFVNNIFTLTSSLHLSCFFSTDPTTKCHTNLFREPVPSCVRPHQASLVPALQRQVEVLATDELKEKHTRWIGVDWSWKKCEKKWKKIRIENWILNTEANELLVAVLVRWLMGVVTNWLKNQSVFSPEWDWLRTPGIDLKRLQHKCKCLNEWTHFTSVV